MAERRCPNCGELVPSTSITCPKCFKKLPNDPQPAQRQDIPDGNGRTRTPNKIVAILLSLIPGLFGVLGLGLIYTNPRRKRGYLALLFGLMVFAAAVMLTIGVISIFLAVPMWIIYTLMYLGCLVLTAFSIDIRTSRPF